VRPLKRFGVRGDALGNPADAKNFSQEVRLSVPISSTVDWLVGGVYTHDKSVLGTDLFAVNPATGIAVAPQFLHEPTLTTYEEYAAFTDVTFHFTGRFDLQLGGRESHIAQTYSTSWTGPFVTDIFHQTNPLLPPAQDTRDDTFTYLATPRFKVSSDLMLYARLASGYRPGGPNSNSGINKLPTYSPDKTKNYEIGIKGDVLKHALSFDGSVYYIDWKDMQLLVVDPTTHAGIFVNASTAKSQGLELSVEARPVSGLTLSAWIDLNDAKLTKDLPAGLRGTAVGFDGDKLPVSSRFSGNFSLTHEFRLTAKASGFVGGGVSYIGDRLGNFVPAGPRQNFPSYVRTDLRGGVKYELWAANVFVNNVADKRGLLPSGSTNPNLQYVIQPRTVGLNVSRTF
jgi:iron complex outermembrane receptor protein